MPTERDLIRSLFARSPERVKAFLEKVDVADPRNAEPMIVACNTESLGITGSKQAACCDCFAKIWLSPSTQQMLAERGDLPTFLICPQCMIVRFRTGEHL
jgi:hypothetical protein